MPVQSSQFSSQLLGAVLTITYWGLFFWRTFRRNRGNLVIECGVITIAIFLTMAILSRLISFPNWVFGSLLALVVVLCLATLFFFLLEILRSLRKRKKKRRNPVSAES